MTHRSGLKKEQKEELVMGDKILEWLKGGNDVRFGEWNAAEVEFLNTVQVRWVM